jgi:hypothetical protein
MAGQMHDIVAAAVIAAQEEEKAKVVIKTPPKDPLVSLLEAARVAPEGSIRAETGRPANAKAYRWSSDNVYGAAQELSWATGKDFDEVVNNYIGHLAARCRGDFARKIGDNKKAGNMIVVEAEMTCLDDTNDVAAALLFVASGGKISVITQEGTTDQMLAALSKRDLIISAAAQNALN